MILELVEFNSPKGWSRLQVAEEARNGTQQRVVIVWCRRSVVANALSRDNEGGNQPAAIPAWTITATRDGLVPLVPHDEYCRISRPARRFHDGREDQGTERLR